ncbi:MAG: replication restart helicase PriA [Bacilli bacterium]|jgi:primosomal protein N' (replication factor Y)
MIVNVLVEQRVNKNRQLFSYLVPKFLEDKIKIGIRVLVPFGSRKLEGFVLEEVVESPLEKLKEVIKVIDEEPILNKEMMKLGQYMADIYLAPLISCYQTMLPSALKAKRKNKTSIKKETYIILNQDQEMVLNFLKESKAFRQKEILELLLSKKKLKKKDIISRSALKVLLELKMVKESKEEVYRLEEVFFHKDFKPSLTKDQKRVMEEVLKGKEEVYLLHGVTGSGKTEVYMRIIEEVLKEEKTAIVLVPEIALTIQVVNKFKSRFQENVALLHSRLSAGERYDEWRKIERGEVSIVIGPRSAIFAPLTRIGIIIIDEEQEMTYKQENNPRYHALDIASYRRKNHQAKILLGSATPSLESYARARKGLYKLLTLKERINQKNLPFVKVVDMKESIKEGYPLFSKSLIKKIEERLKKKEQIMILLNRRGYANYLICKNCGFVFKCPFCDITLTYHKAKNNLRCHYCGYADNKNDICPSCQSKDLMLFGVGTEKIEEELQKLIPKIRIVRMDLDTTSKKGAHKKIIQDFNQYKYDLLVGTQMIAKGLDFSLVTLVGVINGDMGLYIPDFRSGERTFQLLSQVAGRSGRSQREGEVLFQTFNPDHYVIKMAKEHNYLGFYEEEMQIRRKMFYPPYCFIVLLRVLSKDFKEGYQEALKIGKYLKNNLKDNQILGPTTAGIVKIKRIYRFQCIVKYRKKEEVYQVIQEISTHYENINKIKLEIDFNPYRL